MINLQLGIQCMHVGKTGARLFTGRRPCQCQRGCHIARFGPDLDKQRVGSLVMFRRHDQRVVGGRAFNRRHKECVDAARVGMRDHEYSAQRSSLPNLDIVGPTFGGRPSSHWRAYWPDVSSATACART